MDGKQEGINKGYYESGKLSSETPYVRNNCGTWYTDGIRKRYYISGNIKEEYVFKKGILILGVDYDKNGNQTKLNDAQIKNFNRNNFF